MNAAAPDRYVRCTLTPWNKSLPDTDRGFAEIYIVRDPQDCSTDYVILENANEYDIRKTENLKDAWYRSRMLRGYALLRSVVAARLNCNPDQINYEVSREGKPYLKDNPLFFNVSHTRSGFVFGVSTCNPIGIDVEEVKPDLDFLPVTRRFFSTEETNYIIRAGKSARERFFLLWTRKEALLKCIGTGIVENLSQVEVFRRVNLIPDDLFKLQTGNELSRDHYIFSTRCRRHFMSVALPCRARIEYYSLDTSGQDIRINPDSCEDL